MSAPVSATMTSAVRAAIPGMVQTRSWKPRNGSNNVSIRAVSRSMAAVCWSIRFRYPTSKAAITGYTRHLATYRSGQLRANAVGPGMTHTPRLAGFAGTELGQSVIQRIPLHRMGTAEEMAHVILFLLSPLASYVNGVFVPVDGGWTVAQ